MGININRGSASTVTFTTPQQIVISHADDSIQIGDGTRLAQVLDAAPASDTGQRALAVRVISQLGAGSSGSGLTNTELRATPVPVSASSLPLPTGAATEGTLGNIQTSVQLIDDGVGTVGSASTTKGMAALGHDGTNARILKTNASGELQIGVSTALPAGSNVIGALTANQSVNNAQINGVAPLMGNGITGTGSQRVTIASDNTAFPVNSTLSAETTKVIGTINAPALTKGTQGANGFTVQNLKDAGRNQTNFFMAIQIVSTNTDALLSLTGYKSGAAVTATTTPAVVTAGKTYRITSLTLTYVTIVTTPGAIRFTLRANTSGVVAIGSPAVNNWTVGEPTGGAPVAGKFYTVVIPFPEGLEFAAGTGIGISQVGLNTVGTAAAVGYGIASITGFEY